MCRAEMRSWRRGSLISDPGALGVGSRGTAFGTGGTSSGAPTPPCVETTQAGAPSSAAGTAPRATRRVTPPPVRLLRALDDVIAKLRLDHIGDFADLELECGVAE